MGGICLFTFLQVGWEDWDHSHVYMIFSFEQSKATFFPMFPQQNKGISPKCWTTPLKAQDIARERSISSASSEHHINKEWYYTVLRPLLSISPASGHIFLKWTVSLIGKLRPLSAFCPPLNKQWITLKKCKTLLRCYWDRHMKKKSSLVFGPFDSEHFDVAEWSKGGIYPSPTSTRFHPGVTFACGGIPANVRKGTVSNSYLFFVLKSCVLINVTAEGYDGATTAIN